MSEVDIQRWISRKPFSGFSLNQAKHLGKGPFKYYIIKEVGGWGQIMTIFDDLQYCKSSKRWVGGPKKVKNMMT